MTISLPNLYLWQPQHWQEGRVAFILGLEVRSQLCLSPPFLWKGTISLSREWALSWVSPLIWDGKYSKQMMCVGSTGCAWSSEREADHMMNCLHFHRAWPLRMWPFTSPRKSGCFLIRPRGSCTVVWCWRTLHLWHLLVRSLHPSQCPKWFLPLLFTREWLQSLES